VVGGKPSPEDGLLAGQASALLVIAPAAWATRSARTLRRRLAGLGGYCCLGLDRRRRIV